MSHPADAINVYWPDAGLTPIERALVAYLLGRGDQVADAHELLREVWGYHPTARTKTVETTVRRVRLKIEPDPQRPRFLLTLRGRGYQLVSPEPARVARGGAGVPVAGLPPEASSFVGRARELEAVEAWMEGGQRLITLHGGPGIGKTRLAGRLAMRWAARFGDAAWFFDLGDARSPEDVISAMRRTLGMLQPPGRAPLDALVERIRDRERALVVLDNFEQLVPHANHLVARLVQECGAQVIVTSRAPLHLDGERVVPIPPLAVSEAVELLRDRLEAVRPDQREALDPARLATVVDLLERVPLVIEVAAGRGRLLPLADLKARLERRFDLLRAGHPAADGRHETLQHAIAWSWELLSDAEQRGLASLSAFRGGCPAGAAEEVLASDDALDVLARLLDTSLVRGWRDDRGSRIGLFESVRAFVQERGGAELDEARERHARWALRVASSWAEAYDSDPEAGPALVGELDNLTAAHDRLLAAGRPEAADLLWALRHVHYAHGLPTDYAERVQATLSADPSPTQEGRMRLALARAYGLRREPERLEMEARRGLSVVGPDDPLRADLVLCLARAALLRGDPRRACELCADAVALAERGGTTESLPRHLNVLGIALEAVDRRPEAVDAYRRALREADTAGADRLSATLWSNLAGCLGAMGEPRRALDALDRAGRLAERFGDRSVILGVRVQMAALQGHLGDVVEADRLFQSILADDERLDQQSLTAAMRINAGIAALLVGDAARAERVLSVAWRRLKRGGIGGATAAVCLSALLACYADLDDLEAAEQVATELRALDLDALPASKQEQIAIWWGHLDLLRSRRAAADGDPDAALRHRRAAEERHTGGRAAGERLALVTDLLGRALRVTRSAPPGGCGG